MLVTGSDGFVGAWLMAHLAANGDHAAGLDPAIDITDAAAVRAAVVAARPEAICHLAAQASVGVSWGDGGRTYEINTLGAVRLLDAAAACPEPPRVLIVSSSEVYGMVRPEDLPLGEDRPLRPASPYAASKAAAEMVGLQAWLGGGVPVVRVRPFNHTGPGQRADFVVPSLARQLAEAARSGARSIQVGNLSARRDLTDVRDVVRAYRLLLSHGEPGEVYNVCRGASLAIQEVLERLRHLAGSQLPIVVDPARVRPVDLPDLRGDPSRLRAATGWEPEIDLDRTLADVLAAWTPDANEPARS
ncbi:MAG: GDP-mannose 4,6-dehydratase [Acidimicrobiales bacterium]